MTFLRVPVLPITGGEVVAPAVRMYSRIFEIVPPIQHEKAAAGEG